MSVRLWVGLPAAFALIGVILDSLGAQTFGHIFFTLTLIAIAAGLYRIRETERLIYGLGELLVGLVGAYSVFQAYYAPGESLADQPVLLQMVLSYGAMYVLVRAFDSIGVGLKGTSFEKNWRTFFQLGSANG